MTIRGASLTGQSINGDKDAPRPPSFDMYGNGMAATGGGGGGGGGGAGGGAGAGSQNVPDYAHARFDSSQPPAPNSQAGYNHAAQSMNMAGQYPAQGIYSDMYPQASQQYSASYAPEQFINPQQIYHQPQTFTSLPPEPLRLGQAVSKPPAQASPVPKPSPSSISPPPPRSPQSSNPPPALKPVQAPAASKPAQAPPAPKPVKQAPAAPKPAQAPAAPKPVQAPSASSTAAPKPNAKPAAKPPQKPAAKASPKATPKPPKPASKAASKTAPKPAAKPAARPSASSPNEKPRQTPVPIPPIPGRPPHKVHKVQASTASPKIPSPTLPKKSPSMATKKSPAMSSKAVGGVNTLPYLIGVAEECLGNARGAAADIASAPDGASVEQYQSLIGTSLSCMEAALQNSTLTPRQEARLRLRYAAVLAEETENTMDVETALTKGITLCDKHRYADLKYCMHYNQVRVMFQRNQKSAVIHLERVISDALEFRHIHWVYALRLLKANLFAQSGNAADAGALENLRNLSSLATRRGDLVLAVLASVMEGFAVLKTVKSDSLDKVQACIAQASKYQCEPAARSPTVEILILLLDLICSMHEKNPDITSQKLRALQHLLDNTPDDVLTRGEILIPIKKHPAASQALSVDTSSVIRPAGPGEEHDTLVVSSLNKLELYILVHTLDGLASFHKGSRSLTLWNEALGLLNNWKQAVSAVTRGRASLRELMRSARWKSEMSCYILIFMALHSSTHSQWDQVRECLSQLDTVGQQWVAPGSFVALLRAYATASLLQGTGDLPAALQALGDRVFALEGPNKARPRQDICLLAALNRLWVLQHGDLQDRQLQNDILEAIQPLCADHPDKEIRIAYTVVLATIERSPPATLNEVRTNLQTALNLSRQAGNTQYLAIALSIMRYRLFENVVGEQALKSAKAASVQAKRGGNLLWQSVADGMLAHSYRLQGRAGEAETAGEAATRCASDAFGGAG